MFSLKQWLLQRKIDKANARVSSTTEAYAKAEWDGVSPEDKRKAAQDMQRALKHLDSLVGTYRPRIKRRQ